MISRTEFENLAKWARNDPRLADDVFNDYNCWLCHSELGQYLWLTKQYEPAISILEAAVDGIIGYDCGHDKHFWSIFEIQIFNFRCLSDAMKKGRRNMPLAYTYIEKSLCLVEQSKVCLYGLSRGDILLEYLDLKVLISDKTQAIQEAVSKLNTIKLKDGMCNSYYFYGYAFLAKMELQQGDAQRALYLFKIALEYYPGPDDLLLKQSDGCSDPAEALSILWPHFDKKIPFWGEPCYE